MPRVARRLDTKLLRAIAGGVACLAVALLAPAGALAATPLTIGSGHKPGVAVDGAGTAYIAWYGPESNVTSLHFCRLPRGAGACDVATTIAAPGTTLSRPFVTVDGATVRVVSYRYGLTGARFDEIWEFTSADGGATFDAGHPVGIAPFDEAVRGPGNTLTVTTNAESTGLAVQNIPLDGTTAGDSQAILSADHPYNGTVGFASARWPARRLVAVFADGSSQAQFRLFGSSRRPQRRGELVARRSTSATPTTRAWPAALRACSCSPERRTNVLTVRRFNGATFGPA